MAPRRSGAGSGAGGVSGRESIPIQPTEEPILCSPYAEPDQHWLYDTTTGLPSKIPGRREAGYWYRRERTGSAQRSLLPEEERDDLPLVNLLREDVRRWRKAGWPGASETTKRLLRHWWREDRPRRLFFCQLEAVETILYLQEILERGRHIRWRPRLARDDFLALRRGENPRPGEWVARVAQHPKLADIPHDPGLVPLLRYACKMATGAGKTVVMAMLIAWAFCNRGVRPGDPRYAGRVLVVCPNLTIKERLAVLRPDDPGSYYEAFDLVPPSMRPELAKGKVLVTNWHALSPAAQEIRVGGVSVGNLGVETPEAFARARLGELWDDEPLMVLNDEGHHAYRPGVTDTGMHLSADEQAELQQATVWVEGLDRINAACGVAFCVDLSATPFYIQGSGWPEGSPFPWIVSDFSLVDAIESGITKIPRLPAIDSTGRADPKYFRLWDHVKRAMGSGDRLPGGKPKPEAVYREAQDALLTLAGEWKERFEQLQAAAPGEDRTPPVMIVVCDNTDLADHLHRMISGEKTMAADPAEEVGDGGDVPPDRKRTSKPVRSYGAGLPGFNDLWNEPDAEVTLRIDSKLLAAAESEDPKATRKEAGEALRRIVSTVGTPGAPGERIRCVVSVNMLSEGWDASNVTHILGLRAFHSQLLCEQVVGRGLRRMDYTIDPATGLLSPEYVDIFGVPFSLIPFKGREPGGKAPIEDRPRHEVMALPERSHHEIRFPVVEGYVTSLHRHRIVCSVDDVGKTTLDPWSTPTAAFVQPQVGYKFGLPGSYGGFALEEVDRTHYYESVHPQTIEFCIAEAVVRELTEAAHPGRKHLATVSRQVLFPQVLRIVQAYVRHRVDLNGMNPRDIGLQTYAERITGLLVAAIEPDESAGETPPLPRLNRYRPTGSTADVRYKTVKPVRATVASHLNYVACDTGQWEQAAVFQLEQLAKEGLCESYARNDGLGFNIPYEHHGYSATYEPDFIARLVNGVHLVIEIKGREHSDTNAKHQAAKRWVSAVNHWRELGEWAFLVCWNPQRLGDEIRAWLAARKERSRTSARRLHAEAREEEAKLRSQGWQQAHFAQALIDLLDEPGA